jgi:hypothetical protein
VRSEFRDVARLRRDRFLTADILVSMPLQAGRRRAERFHVLPGGNQFVQVIHDAFLPQKLGGNIHNSDCSLGSLPSDFLS